MTGLNPAMRDITETTSVSFQCATAGRFAFVRLVHRNLERFEAHGLCRTAGTAKLAVKSACSTLLKKWPPHRLELLAGKPDRKTLVTSCRLRVDCFVSKSGNASLIVRHPRLRAPLQITAKGKDQKSGREMAVSKLLEHSRSLAVAVLPKRFSTWVGAFGPKDYSGITALGKGQDLPEEFQRCSCLAVRFEGADLMSLCAGVGRVLLVPLAHHQGVPACVDTLFRTSTVHCFGEAKRLAGALRVVDLRAEMKNKVTGDHWSLESAVGCLYGYHFATDETAWGRDWMHSQRAFRRAVANANGTWLLADALRRVRATRET